MGSGLADSIDHALIRACDVVTFLVSRAGDIVTSRDDGVAGDVVFASGFISHESPWKTIYDVFDVIDAEKFGELLDSRCASSELQLMRMCDGSDVAVRVLPYREMYYVVQCFPARQWRDVVNNDQQMRSLGHSLMQTMGEQGAILGFFREAVSCDDAVSFIKTLFRALERFGLQAVLSLHHPNLHVMMRHDGGSPTACEQRLLDACKGCSEKIVCAGPRSLFRGSHLSFVIKNMPSDDELAGRLRDHLAVLLDGADALINRLLQNSAESRRKEMALIGALSNNERMLKLLDQEFDRQTRMIMSAIDTVIGKMYSEFCYLHLTDTEEDKLIKIINEGIAPLTEVVTSTVTLQRVIRASVQQLKSAIEIEDGRVDVMMGSLQ